MARFGISNISILTSQKITARDVEKVVERLHIQPSEDPGVADAQEVPVAALQLMLKRYTSLSEYIVDMNLYLADAVNRRAQLVLFPAFAGLLPLAFLPQRDAVLREMRPAEEGDAPDSEAVASALSYLSDSMFEAYYSTMSQLAGRHRIYVAAGSTLYFDRDSLRHRAFLFDRQGDLVGYQDKLSLTPFEQELGLEPAGELKVFDTPAGPVSFLIGSDADYYETARVAKSLGAKILLHPAALRGEYTPVRAAMGIAMRAQETRLWGLQSTLVGDTGLGFAAEGPCALFGPAHLSKTRNGAIARSSGRFEPDILCKVLNHDYLIRGRSPYTQDHNIEFLEKYIDRLHIAYRD